ncbi:hypothetical protein P5V15_001117 [Pogonomyrmex californicus]
MNSTNEQRTTQKERTSTREKKEGNEKGKTILDHLIPRSRAGSEGLTDILNKRRRNKEEDKTEAEREFLGKFEKARKITRSGRKTHYKEEKRSMTETEGSAIEDKNMMEEDIRIIKEFMKDIREKLKNKKEKWERRIREAKNKIENLVIGNREDEDLQEKIRKLEKLEEIREKKERRNYIVIKRWKVPKRESLEAVVEELLKNKLSVDAIVEEACWTKRRTNMVRVKIKGSEKRNYDKKKESERYIFMVNIFIDNNLIWKKRQVKKEIRMIAEAEKERGAKVKIGYRRLQVNKKKFTAEKSRAEKKKQRSREGKDTKAAIQKYRKGIQERRRKRRKQKYRNRYRNKKIKRKIKIGFWNIAGLDNKDVQFREYIKEFDIIGMIETWIEEKRWNKLEEHMPENFNWECQHAKREKNKGRAIGEIIT